MLVGMRVSSVSLIPLILFFSFSISVSKNAHNFLLFFYDFHMVKLSYFALLFILTFIVMTIFHGSSRTSEGEPERFFPPPSFMYELNTSSYIEVEESTTEDDDDDEEECHGNHDYGDKDNDDELGTEDVDNRNESDHEDLEKRIEEFITKVYRKWKEELLTDRLLCIEAA